MTAPIPGLRVVAGHKRTFLGLAVGILAWFLIPLHPASRLIAAWDCGGLVFLVACAVLFSGTSTRQMPGNAKAQQEGEWSIFAITVLGVVISFTAIVTGFGGSKNLGAETREMHVALIALTLLVSWLVLQVTFSLRYAHEYYTRSDGARLDGGLNFPSDDDPDYWDFLYFATSLGMCFQVSDVQIEARKLRRLATVHGFLSFLFNTVIIAVTVNIASGFLS